MIWVQVRMQSKAVGMPVSFHVLLPNRWQPDMKTLYVLHGFQGDRSEWLLETRLKKQIEDRQFVVVLPEGANSFFVNLPSGHAYADFLCEELPAYMELNFPVSKRCGDRIICGVSMGGYGAFRQALVHPEAFGYAASFSGVLDAGSLYQESGFIAAEQVFGREEDFEESDNNLFAAAERPFNKESKRPKLFMSCGTEDPYLPHNRALYHELTQSRWDITYQECSGGHDWEFAEEAFGDMLKWLAQGGIG